MASVLDQIPSSTLSLQGNGYNPQPNSPDWGYIDASANVDPAASKLQNTYSINNNPVIRLKDFNRTGTALIRPGASLDELDPNAPSNTQAGMPGSVVSQIYKSATGRKYKDLGPQPGRY